MSENLLVGLLATLVPLFVAGYLMLQKQAAIFRMFVAMLLVGVGYLTATGAIEDIGARVTGKANANVEGVEPVAAPASEVPKTSEKPAADKPAEAPAGAKPATP